MSFMCVNYVWGKIFSFGLEHVVSQLKNFKVNHIIVMCVLQDASVALNSALVIISGGKLGQSRPMSSRARASSASFTCKH